MLFKGTLCIQICEGEARASPAAAWAKRIQSHDKRGSAGYLVWSLNNNTTVSFWHSCKSGVINSFSPNNNNIFFQSWSQTLLGLNLLHVYVFDKTK